MKMSSQFVIPPEEVDCFVQSLRKFQIAEIGCESWFDQNERILKLAQQTFIEATTEQEEIVKERLVIEEKTPVLVNEIYCVFLWRHKVLPKLVADDELPATFMLYSVFYYELNIVALLENVLFHPNCCEALGDVSLDLIDYCARAVGLLIGVDNNVEQSHNESSKEELERISRQMVFRIGMKCLSIMSSLTNNLGVLPMGAIAQLTRVHDVPCLISEILTAKPWLRKSKRFEKYIDDHWQAVHGEEIVIVTKVEAQTWFCLFGLLFNENAMRYYEITQFRQKEIGRCTCLLNEHVLDQLPALTQLKQFLCAIQMGNAPRVKQQNSLLLEEMPQLENNLISNAAKFGWGSIVQTHKKIFIEPTLDQITTTAKKLSEVYGTDVLEMCTSGNDDSYQRFCATCRIPAVKKCSKCESVFYCSRKCQVSDWSRHKELCHQLKAI